MMFIFIYKLSSEVGQKFNFSAWFFSFFENTIVIGFLGVCWLPLSCIPNFHSPLLVALGLVRVSSRKLLGYHTSGGNLHILGLRNKCFFCISCHACGFAAFYVSKQSTAGSGLCFTSSQEKPSRALIHLGGPSREREGQCNWRSSVC